MSAARAKSSKFANTADEAEKGPLPRTKSQASLINQHENELPNPPGAFTTFQLNGKDAKGAQKSTNKAKYSALNTDREGPFAADCAEDAKIWEQYMNQAKISDEELSKILNSDLDSLLIFAGLFSAILSAFLIEVRKGLQEDLQVKTNNLLLTLIRIQQNPSNSVILESSSFAPTLATIRINAFWFVSLILSLLSALGASLAKGWVMQYASRASGVNASDACSRHCRFIGITRWHLQMIVQSLPILLHVAFFLFSAGLIILLQDDNIQIANLILSLVVIMAVIYIGSSLLPLIWSDCPFQTPVSILIDRVFKELTGFRNDNTASDIVKSQALSWMLQNSADDSITLRIIQAIAGLPATPEVQDALYASQVAGLLVRGFVKHLKSSSKTGHDDPLQSSSLVIYLHAILRLVQTRHMDPEISPRLVELAKSGGSLDVDEKGLDDGVLKLVICVRARILLLLGDCTPSDGSENGLFDVRIPVLLRTSRPGFHTAHLSEVYVMSHPQATKMGNLLDMLRNEELAVQRHGYRTMLEEAERIVTEVDKTATFGIRKLLDGLMDSSIYLQQYYAAKMEELAQSYGAFRRILTKHIEVQNLFNRIQCDDEAIQKSTIKAISILANDADIRQSFFTREMIIDLCQVTQRVKKSIKLEMISLLEMLVEENDIQGHFVADEVIGVTLCLIDNEDGDIRRVAILYATKLARSEVLREKIWGVEVTARIIDKLSDDDEGICVAAISFVGELVQYSPLWTEFEVHEVITIIVGHVSHSKSAIRVAAQRTMMKIMEYDDIRSKYIAQEMVIAFFSKLGDLDPDVRQGAVNMMGQVMQYDDIRSKYITQEMVNAVINKLEDGDWHTKCGAVNMIGKLIEYDDIHSKYVTQEMINTIANKLCHRDPNLPRALDVIGKLMEYDDTRSKYITQEMVNTVVNKLGEKDWDVKQGAANVIGTLIQYDDVRSKYVTQEMINTVVKLTGRNSDGLHGPVSMIGKLIQYDDIRSKYVTQEVVSAVINKLDNANSLYPREGAADVICRLIEYDDARSKCITQEIVTALVNELDSQYPSGQRGAVEVMHKLTQYDDICSKYVTQEVVNAVVNHLCDQNSHIRRGAVDVIGKLIQYDDVRSKYLTQEMVNTIINKLGDEDLDGLYGAVSIIGKLMEYDDTRSKYVTEEMVNAVINKLGHRDSGVRHGAVDMIGKLIQYDNFRTMIKTPDVITRISNWCGDSNPDVQMSVLGMVSSLEKLDLPSMVLTTIINKLNDSSNSTQTATVALTLFAEQDDLRFRSIEPEAIAAIVSMTGHRDQTIQVSSIKILTNLSKYDHHHNLIFAANAVEVTIGLLQSLTRDNRARAIQLLMNLRIASVASSYFPRLISLFSDPNPEVVNSSIPILLQMAEQDLVFDNRTLQIWDAIDRMLREPRTGTCAIQALKAFAKNEMALHEIVYDSAIVPTLLWLLESRSSSGNLWHLGAEGLLILDKF